MRDATGDEVFQHLVLRIHGDALAVGESLDVEMVPFAVPLERDAAVEMRFPHHPLADAEFVHQFHDPMFEHPGADRALDLHAAAAFEIDRADPGTVEQMCEEQAGRSGADDAHLSTHVLSPCRRGGR